MAAGSDDNAPNAFVVTSCLTGRWKVWIKVAIQAHAIGFLLAPTPLNTHVHTHTHMLIQMDLPAPKPGLEL